MRSFDFFFHFRAKRTENRKKVVAKKSQNKISNRIEARGGVGANLLKSMLEFQLQLKRYFNSLRILENIKILQCNKKGCLVYGLRT